jgi:cellulose synthase (UDP-forming)
VWPALLAVAVLVGAAAYGLSRGHDPSTLNNVAFAGLHVCVLLAGAWPALRRPEPAAAVRPAELPRASSAGRPHRARRRHDGEPVTA